MERVQTGVCVFEGPDMSMIQAGAAEDSVSLSWLQRSQLADEAILNTHSTGERGAIMIRPLIEPKPP